MASPAWTRLPDARPDVRVPGARRVFTATVGGCPTRPRCRTSPAKVERGWGGTVRAVGTTWTRRAREVSDLPARLALGGAMLYHGLAKLRGDGVQQTAQMFESLGLRPGRALAVATGLAESFAGAAAILGIATRPAALAVLVTQAVAIRKVHAPKGYDVMSGGMEYNLAIVAMALQLLVEPPRAVSAHGAVTRLLRRRHGFLPELLHTLRPTAADRALALLH